MICSCMDAFTKGDPILSGMSGFRTRHVIYLRGPGDGGTPLALQPAGSKGGNDNAAVEDWSSPKPGHSFRP